MEREREKIKFFKRLFKISYVHGCDFVKIWNCLELKKLAPRPVPGAVINISGI